jgi:hypothetical protein
MWHDTPQVEDNPMPASFDLWVTRVMYIKLPDGKKILGANTWHIVRNEGDNATAVRANSSMNALFVPPNLDDAPEGLPAPITTADSENMALSK